MANRISLTKSVFLLFSFFALSLISFGQAERMNDEFILQLKKGFSPVEAQAELNEWVINAALQGRNVVRLKIGDPFLFGRVYSYRCYCYSSMCWK
jgi:siroheme synthase